MVNINFQVRTENLQESTREYMQERINRLEKLLTKYENLTIKLDTVSNPNSKSRFRTFQIEITVKMPNAFVKVENKGKVINTTFDDLLEPLQKKLTRYHDQAERFSKYKDWKFKQFIPEGDAEDTETTVITDYEPTIRRKILDTDQPLHPAEAVEKMELLGNNCYLFKNIENNRYAMLYKTSNGNYTLVQPPV